MPPKDPLPITLCLTLGGRPDHLRRTLASLLVDSPFAAVLAINDFRDEASSAVFRAACPLGTLIVPPRRLGHHAAVDVLYRNVRTPYVFHCEDDWLFVRPLDWQPMLRLLNRNQRMTQLCLRRVEDFRMPARELRLMRTIVDKDITYVRLDDGQPHWHGYTFNPHLASMELWRDLGGFSAYRSEWDLSSGLRNQGRFVAYLYPGACTHIGGDHSMASPVQRGGWKRWLRWPAGTSTRGLL